LPVRSPVGARVAGHGPSLPPPVPDGVVVTRTLEGVPVSSGLITGRARRVDRIEDGWSLGPDEVLLARAATPSWTPLFFFSRGVILDIGGMLSHCAVIAREYGIPCVVGLKTATAEIPDGAMVTVDAYHGRVYLHAAPQEGTSPDQAPTGTTPVRMSATDGVHAS
jgi:pyruvate,water dikinase